MARNTGSSDLISLDDLLKQLGDIAPHRIRMRRPPGKATEKDILTIQRREGRLYELVDGVLVEKVMGAPESALAADIILLLGPYIQQHQLGMLMGADGTLRLMPGLVRIADVSFVAREHLPNGERPTEAIPDLAPDLAVEVLSKGNTKAEMDRKTREYFFAGSRLVWLVDPKTRSVTVYLAPDQSTTLVEGDALDGGDVLPGLTLPVAAVFAEVPRQPSAGEEKGATRRKGKRRPQKD
jgi:Uma2 family endonuclease